MAVQSPNRTSMLVLTGATGQLGRRIIKQLLSASFDPQRLGLSVRRPAAAAHLQSMGVRVRQAAYDQLEQLQAAFEGAERLLIIASDGSGNDVLRHHRNVIEAAKHVGVRHIFYTSILDVDAFSPFYFAHVHRQTEDYLRATGIPVTIFRLSIYASLIIPWARQALQTGELRLPAGDGRVSFVAHDDLARAIATTLMQGEAEDQLYELTGPEALDFHDVAEILSRMSRREVRYRNISRGTFLQKLWDENTEDWLVHAFDTMFESIAEDRFSGVTETIQHRTKHIPQRFAQFLKDALGDER